MICSTSDSLPAVIIFQIQIFGCDNKVYFQTISCLFIYFNVLERTSWKTMKLNFLMDNVHGQTYKKVHECNCMALKGTIKTLNT